jgi:hypothetical protein
MGPVPINSPAIAAWVVVTDSTQAENTLKNKPDVQLTTNNKRTKMM